MLSVYGNKDSVDDELVEVWLFSSSFSLRFLISMNLWMMNLNTPFHTPVCNWIGVGLNLKHVTQTCLFTNLLPIIFFYCFSFIKLDAGS